MAEESPPNNKEILETWPEPPHNAISRINRKKDQREKTHYLSNLRRAFESADNDKVGSLTHDQWMSSDLRRIIHDGALSEEDFETLFKKIDANTIGRVKWADLVHYLACDVSTVPYHHSSETVNFIEKFTTVTPKKCNIHRDMIKTVIISNRTNEYVTVSPDSVRFWRQSDLSFVRCIAENCRYRTAQIFDLLQVIVIATSNRQLFFYNLENLNKLQIEISASPNPKNLKKMTKEDAEKTLGMIDSKNPELYNMPVIIHISELSDEELQVDPLFFVGDDQGALEIFRITAPRRRAGTDYKCQRLAKVFPHKETITQISTIREKSCYASSSSDMTVKFWSFNIITNEFQITQTFTSDEPIMTFTYSYMQKNLVTTGITRDVYVWNEDSARRIFKLRTHYNPVQLITDYETSNKEKYLLTMTNKKEFRIWDPQNFSLVREFADRQILYPENRYSAGIFDHRRKVFVAASCYPVIWGEDVGGSVEFERVTTHSRPIVGCFYVPEFGQLLSVDSLCCIKSHSIETGELKVTHLNNHEEQSEDIAAATLDNTKRRLITSTFSNKVTIWNYNSGIELGDPQLDGKLLISTMIMGKYDGKDILVRAGWDKLIFMYIEIEKGKFDLLKIFEGHTNDISFLCLHKDYLVSATFSGEIIVWNLTLKKQAAKVNLYSGVESMIVVDNFVLVGDTAGFLYVYSFPYLENINQFFSQDLAVRVQLTSLTFDETNNYLYVGDSLGYLKKWSVKFEDKDDPKFEKVGFWRLHVDDITDIILLPNNVIATCGIDNCIRLWSDDFDFIGVFSDESKWNTKDRSTWVVEKPFEIEAKHVHKIKATISMRRSFNKFNFPMPIITESPLAKEEENETQEVEVKPDAPLDIQNILKKMDEFCNMEDKNDKLRNDETSELPPKQYKKLPHLKITSRAHELNDKILNLQYSTNVDIIKRKYNIRDQSIRSSCQPTLPPALAKSLKRTVKLPIPHCSPIKRRIPKLAKSAPVYDY